MLSPDYIGSCPEELLGMMDELARVTVEDMARRIAKMDMLTDTARFQAELLQASGMLFDDLIARVAEVLPYTQEEVYRIFEDAAYKNLDSENKRAMQYGDKPPIRMSRGMQRMISSQAAKTAGHVGNLTKTTAMTSQAQFISSCSAANLAVSTGVKTYTQAVADAVKEIAHAGNNVRYPTGHKDKLDVAARRAVLTGVNQTAAQQNEMICDEFGTDLVEVTAHSGARPSHAEWQGKIFSRSGTHPNYPDFETATGYGTGAGLCGWNCRHNFYAYFEGGPRTYTKELLDEYNNATVTFEDKEMPLYDATQKQRAYERKIRADKRELAGLNQLMKEYPEDKALKIRFESKAIKLKSDEAKVRRFCKETGIRRDRTREQVKAIKTNTGKIIGFNRSVSQKAVRL